ncbi:C-type lectin lectoxin-Phi1-like [Pelobates fuscus]|uniref:C-type lectin lectoxin-Phi1-like n=1 Tax=Pelobates fuscus TaxID=191477 RepID=UPI002FE4654C
MQSQSEVVYDNVYYKDNQTEKKQGKCKKLLPVLVIILILTVLILSILIGILLIFYSAVSDELREMKQNECLLWKSCPNGWQKAGYYCYKITDNGVTWREASDFCNKSSSTLAIISSEKVMTALYSLLNDKQRYWIGLQKDNGTNVWKWQDGTKLTFTHWDDNEPNNYNGIEYCGEIRYLGWNDASCDSEKNIICMKTLSC